MKQTAVEWLEKICNDRGYHLMSEYFNQAKEMEKQQIIDAQSYAVSHADMTNNKGYFDCEKYYNETFNL